MSVFDLIFIGFFLGAVGYAVRILYLLLRRRWIEVRRHSIRWAAATGLYLLVVVLVGVSSTRRTLAAEELLRYDDWCLGVEKAVVTETIGEMHAEEGKRFLVATLRVSSTARRAQAAPKGALVYVIDDAGTRYELAEQAQMTFEKLNGSQLELTAKLDPQGSFLTTRIFAVPRDAKEIFLGHRHGSGSRFPGMFIIGTGFGKAPVIRLQIARVGGD